MAHLRLLLIAMNGFEWDKHIFPGKMFYFLGKFISDSVYKEELDIRYSSFAVLVEKVSLSFRFTMFFFIRYFLLSGWRIDL